MGKYAFVFFLSTDSSAGQFVHMLEVAKGLKERDFIVALVVSNSCHSYASRLNLSRLKKLEDIFDEVIMNEPKHVCPLNKIPTKSIRRIVISTLPLILLLPKMKKLKNVINKADRVVSILGMYYFTPRNLFKRFKDNYKIAMVYDLIPYELKEYGLMSDDQVRSFTRSLLKSLAPSHVVATSTEYTYQQLREILKVKKPRVPLPPPVERPKGIKPLNRDDEYLTLSYLGSLEPKRLYPLLAMLKGLGQISGEKKLILMGCYKQSEIEKVMNTSKKANVEMEVIRCPSDEYAFSIIASSDLFVFPTLSEGFGIPPMQALALNKPVVTSGIRPLTDIYGKCAVYADEPLNPSSWREAILKGLNFELNDECKNLVDKYSREYVIENFLHSLSQHLNLRDLT